jgi:hypothetical protein
MKSHQLVYLLGLTISIPLAAQNPPQPAPDTKGPQPIYRVMIVSRTTKALNYGHRTLPTKIDFKGTELLPQAKGDATIESKRGAVQIQAHFEHVASPQRFGTGYLTYVVWAISPEGRPQNLGELVLNGADKGKLDASTQMQAFAIIVTAEPYFSVTQPSNVVVMENMVRPDTVGKVEEVNATYELLPRDQTFTYEPGKPIQEGPAVSMNEYEATVAIYQAQNAIQHAQTAGAERLAPEKLAKAQELLKQAQAQSYDKSSSKEVVAIAREAAQTAEDARVIATKRSAAESPAPNGAPVSSAEVQQ